MNYFTDIGIEKEPSFKLQALIRHFTYIEKEDLINTNFEQLILREAIEAAKKELDKRNTPYQ